MADDPGDGIMGVLWLAAMPGLWLNLGDFWDDFALDQAVREAAWRAA
jgi:hypothetical protein